MNVKGYGKNCFKNIFFPLGVFFIITLFLWKAIAWRVGQTYLEDDVAWFFLVIDQLLSAKLSIWALIKSFHLPELTLFDSAYFAFLRFIFGYNFSLYPLPSFLVHLVNGVLIYQILVKGFQRSQFIAILASVIYLTFYGQYHAYLWPMAMHHMLGVSWILIFVYEYLKIINNDDTVGREKKPNVKLYVLAFAASFMRLSVLIIPLMIGMHIALSTFSRKDFLLKIKRWVPIFLIISWYQVIILLIGKHGDVFSSFLKIENFILLVGVFLFLWFLFRRNVQRIYYCWLMIPFIFILSFYLWIFPQKTLVSSVIALRWQVMPLPTGTAIWIFLAALSLGIMYAFTRYVMCRDSRFGIFIAWYLLLFPYLLFRLNEIPSRYLIYVSPVFAVVIAVFFGEMIVGRLKGFYRNIFQFMIAILFIWLSYVNIQSIHERSMRSFFADYRLWSYENIKIANYIKQDQAKKYKIENFNKNTLCLSGVSQLPYLVAWANHYLPEAKIDGYESLRMTLQSALGVDCKKIKINQSCKPDALTYNFANEKNFAEFQWIPAPTEEDAWMGYGESFDGEAVQLRIDNVIQREINFFNNGKTFWSLVQGDWVERVALFDIYDFKGWYFAIPKGEPFNLARFKIGDYKKSFFAKTRHELRTLITSRFSYDSRIASVSQGGGTAKDVLFDSSKRAYF